MFVTQIIRKEILEAAAATALEPESESEILFVVVIFKFVSPRVRGTLARPVTGMHALCMHTCIRVSEYTHEQAPYMHEPPQVPHPECRSWLANYVEVS